MHIPSQFPVEFLEGSLFRQEGSHLLYFLLRAYVFLLTQVAAKSTKLGQNEAFFARKWCVLGNLKI